MKSGRPANAVGTLTLNVSTTPQIRRALLKLVDYGTYGKNPSDAAERIIAAKIQELALEGRLLNFKDLEVPTV